MRSKAIIHDFEAFRRLIDRVLQHPVIAANEYPAWFSRGEANETQVKNQIGQWGVFSNYFLESQVKRVVRSRTEKSRKESLIILLNEFGVPFGKDGEVEGQKFGEKHIHFNWLCDIARQLKLDMDRFGIWESGTSATQKFVMDLDKVYGSFDPWISEGASFGIENWASSFIGTEKENLNFWHQHIVGYRAFNEKHRKPLGLSPLKLKFFTYHFGLELKHRGSVEKELEENYLTPNFDREKFLEGMEGALDAIYILWQGLNETRKTL